MNRRPCYLRNVACLAVGALALWLPRAQAETFPFPVTNAALGPLPVTFTLVEADGFNAGGTAGNSVSIADPTAFFSDFNYASGSGLWQWRDFGGIDLSGGLKTNLLDLLEGAPLDGRGGANLRTTIAGLAPNTYEVYLVKSYRTDNGENTSLLADLETPGVTSPTTLRTHDGASVPSGRTASVFSFELQPLGQVVGTGFSVLVGPNPAANRCDYIGIAYGPAGAARVYMPPVSQTAFGSSNVTLTAAAFGNPAPALQWLKNGTVIPGATTDTLTLNNVTATDAGLYSVRATNTLGTNISAAAQLNVIVPQSATTSVIAIGTNAPFNFVQADAFLYGGSAGNTVQATNPAGDFAVLNASVAGYWDYRDFASLNFYGGQFGVNDSDPDLLETSVGGGYIGPTLRTIIPGLANAIYEVSLVQMSYNPGGLFTGLLADLDPTGSGTSATTLRQRNAATLRTGVTAGGVWEVDLQPLGQVTGSTIDVLVGDAGGGVNRGDYLGLAYRLAAPSAASILTQPANQVAFAGSNTTFSVSAGGNPLPKYQWHKNGVNIPNATNATYNIASPSASDAGIYSVFVTNNLGGVLSSNALLNVFAPTGPSTVDITVSTNATYHFVQADGFENGGTPGNTALADGSGNFFSNIGQVAGLWNHRDFAGLDMFGVGNPGGLDLLETSTGNVGQPLRTSITGLAAGYYDVYLVHQYRFDNGENVGLLANLPSGGLTGPKTRRSRDANSVLTGKRASVFEVILSPLGQVQGTGFEVLVGYDGANRGDYIGVAYRLASASTPLTIVGNPAGALAYTGGSNTLTVSAIGAPPLGYQWQKNGANIGGATNPVLALTGIATADAGAYTAVVTDAHTNATSASANLNVFAPLGGGLMDITVGSSPTLRFVPADAYTNSGTAGNTVALLNPTAPFAVLNNGATPGSWNYRDFASLDLYSPGTSANLDLLETGSGNSAGLPTLQTTLSGLPAAIYEVFLVHNWRPDAGEQPGFKADIQLPGVTDATTVRRQTVNTNGTLRTGKTVSVFEVVLQPLGQVSGTNFSVLLKNIDASSRGDYYGLAYRTAAATYISIGRNGGLTQITWSGIGTLQAADDVAGPYVAVPAATSPYTVDTSLGKKFYRLQR